jgi:hypothetical protein
MLVLLGGRRALLAHDGTLHNEKVPAPEPLTDIIAVPTPSGPRVVGRGQSGLYRFDDPLGPGTLFARIEATSFITQISPAPGMIVIWDAEGLRSFLDVETGLPGSLPGLPPLPVTSLVFLSMREGAAVFKGSGLAVTTDGGASFHSVPGPDALLARYLRSTGGAVRVYTEKITDMRIEDTLFATLDIGEKRLGPYVSVRAPSDRPPLVRVLERPVVDPLFEAAARGIAAPKDTAVVTVHGGAARIDLRTGNVVALSSLARSLTWGTRCQMERAGPLALLACPLPRGPETGNRVEPFGIARLAVDQPALDVEPLELVRNGWAALRGSPAGGAMLARPCSDDEQGNTCVLQPNGRWVSVRAPFEIATLAKPFRRNFTIAPLSDGKIAHIVMTPGARGGVTAAKRSGADALSQVEGTEIRVETLDPSGKQTILAAAFLEGSSSVTMSSPIEEQPDKTLRFALYQTLQDGPDPLVPYVGTVRPEQATLTLRPVEGADVVFLRGAHGIAASKHEIFITSDGGDHFTAIPTPEPTAKMLEEVNGRWNPDEFSVSEVGATVFNQGLVGWGPPEPLPPERPNRTGMQALAPPIEPLRRDPPSQEPAKLLECSTESGPRAPPPFDANAAKNQKVAAPPGVQASVSTGVNLLLLSSAPEKGTEPPERWTVRWQDLDDRASKVRTWRGPPPKGVSGYPRLLAAVYSDREAILGIDARTKVIVRIREGGEAEAVEAPDGVGLNSLVLGEGEGDPVAWLNEDGTRLYVWARGGPARAIAAFAPNTGASLEPASGGSITVRLEELRWVAPIPPLGAEAGAPPEPLVPGPHDWKRAPASGPDALPLCGPSPRGDRRVRSGPTIRVKVDGGEVGWLTPRYEVRAAGKDTCLAGLSVWVEEVLSPRPWMRRQVAKGLVPYSSIRVDFAGKRADGIEHTDSDYTKRPLVGIRPMRCTWTDRAIQGPY